MRTVATIIWALCLATGADAQLAAARDWAQFRGPGARGIADGGAELPVEFGPEQNVVWKCALPAGNSSPCVVGNAVFVTGAAERELITVCVDRDSGEVRWRQALEVEAVERVHRVNSLASPTPCSDGERVYVYFGSFGLLAYDFEGKEVWRRVLKPAKNIFGTATSPIVVGGRVILHRDTNDDSWVEALDAETGETAWRIDRTGFPSSWSTPVVWRRGDTEELLIYGAFRLTAYDLTDGSERWSVPGLADEPCITPVTGDGMVFVTSYNMHTNPEVIGLPKFDKLLADYDTDGNGTLNRDEVKPNKSILSRMDADGEGDHPLRGFFRFLDADRNGELDATEWQKMHAWLEGFEHANAAIAIRPPKDGETAPSIAWQQPRGVPECPSPLYHDGRLYLVKNGGLASCLDTRTGAVLYRKRLGARGPRYSSPVVGDDKIYAASARGVVTVFKTGDALEVLAHNDLGERIMATPALVDGVIYVRTERTLYAFGKR